MARSVVPSTAPLVIAYKATQDAHIALMNDIHAWVFDELGQSDQNNVGTIVGKIMARPEAKAGPDHRDLFAEVANAIAAAAAIETRSYVNLIEIVCKLVEAAEGGTLWGQTGWRVAENCLQKHLGQTRFYLLQLLEKRVIDIHMIYKFLSVQGVVHGNHMALFYYFAKELSEFKPEWFKEQYQDTFARQLSKDGKYLANLIEPTFPEKLEESFTWDEFIAKRAAGVSDNKLLQAIKADDFAALQAECGEDGFRLTIPFCIHEAYFHYDWKWVVSNDMVGCKQPELMEAIGLFGAVNCFTGVVQSVADKGEMLEVAKGCIVSGRIENGLVRKLDDDFGVNFAGTLKDAIRYHRNEAIEFLMETAGKKAAIDNDALEAAMRYANFPAVVELLATKFDRNGLVNGEPTVYHYAAEGNAIEAFKLLLATHEGEFDAYKTTGTKRNFLHFAARYQAWEVIRFWCSNFGNSGLDLIDVTNKNPAHLAYLWGIYPKAAKGTDVLAKFPEYAYLFKRTDLEYKLETDEHSEE